MVSPDSAGLWARLSDGLLRHTARVGQAWADI